MPTIQIPTEIADRKIGVGGGDFTWPQGHFRGVIRTVREKNLGERMRRNGSNPWAGYASFDVEQLGVELAQITPLDDPTGEVAEEIGQRPYFHDLTIRDGPNTLDSIDPRDGDVDYWQLTRSTHYVAQLARALGAAEVQGGNLMVPDDFLDNLAAGEFNGMEVGFEVSHRQGKPDPETGKRTVYDFVSEFFTA